MENKNLNKPFVKWVYGPNDGHLNGKIGSDIDKDPLPKLIKDYQHPTGFISLSANK